MKSFLTKILFFTIPFVMYLLLIAVIDPYNYFRPNNIICNKIKADVSLKIHYPLWKLNDFRNHSTPNILLGDSRIYHISIDSAKKITGEPFSNLAYGGGSLQEIISTFWETTKITKLKNVYIGLNFNLYNKYNNGDRVKEAVELNKNFFAYALNRYTFKAAFYSLRAQLFNITYNQEIPDMSKEEFWNYQLTVATNGFYKKFTYPKNYYLELKKIAKYCKDNNINLVFFMPPTHTDLQQKVKEFKLSKEEKQFKADINSLGKVYDFDYSYQLTQNKNNFKDPFHIKNTLLDSIFCDVLRKEQINIH